MRIHRTPLGLALALAATLPLAALARAGEDRTRLPAREQARIELGRRLFFDPQVSRSGARACASCHDPEHGFSDPAVRSKDDMGLTRRHSQTLIDVALQPNAHWDGEFESLESLVTARLKPVSNGKGLLSHGASADSPAEGARVPGGSTATEPNPPPTAGATTPRGEPGSGQGGGGGSDPSYAREPNAEGGEAPPPAQGGATGDPRDTRQPSSAGGERPEATPPAEAPKEEKPKEGTPAEGAPKDAPPADGKAPDGSPKDVKPQDAKPKAGPQAPAEPEQDDPDPVVPLDIRRLPRVDASLEHADRYREAFQAAFGSPAVNVARIAEAIAAYSRSIESSRSRYDRFVAGEADALTSAEQRGLALFRGRARCDVCHTLDVLPDGRTLFTDFAFHNTGVAWSAFAREQGAAQTLVGVVHEADKGRERVTTRRQDRRAFKTPSLRDVATRGPWFHDGSASTLEATVHYYAKGGSADPEQSEDVRPLTLTDAEVADVAAFLRALSGETRAGLAAEAWSRRATRTELTFVDGKGRRLAGLGVRVVPAGDRLPGWEAAHDVPLALTTDERGVLQYAPPTRTHVRLELPDGLEPLGGAFVPDTCAAARIQVPVDGRLRLVVEAPPARALPATLVAEHLGVMVLPGHPAPRTVLTRLGAFDGPEGTRLTAYGGWRRTDVPAEVRLQLPLPNGRRGPRLTLREELTTLSLR